MKDPVWAIVSFKNLKSCISMTSGPMKLILCSFVVLVSTLRPPSMNPKLHFLFELCYDFIIFTAIFVIQIPCQSASPQTSFLKFGARERLWVNWSRHRRVELTSDLLWSNLWYVYVLEKIVSGVRRLSEWSIKKIEKQFGLLFRISLLTSMEQET